MSLTELDSTDVEPGPVPDNTFKRILKVSFDWVMLCYPWVDDLDVQAIFCYCAPRKTRLVKAKSFSTIDTV
jgi:hypothetical protein